MKKFLIAMVLLLVVGTMVAPAAMAETKDTDKPILSVTPYLGWGIWSEDMAIKDSFMYGGHLGVHFLSWLSLEGTYGRSGSKTQLDDTSVTLNHFGLDLLAEFMPRAKVTPYIFGGWGQIDYKSDDWEDKWPGYEFGGGLKAKIGGKNNANYRALRFEIRDVVATLNDQLKPDGDVTHNLIASVGLQFAFGTSSRDTDGDGIRDVNDVCADTPMGAVVDPSGCPLDGDGDGVFDGLDKCPDTPANLMVTTEGCPIAVTKTEIELLDTGTIVTSQIAFATSSSDLDRKDTEALKVIGETLSRWPQLKIEIGGHTDSSGSEAFNQKLSERRAQSVLDYLVANYPDIRVSQFTVVGYGEAKPVSDNGTAEGRSQNRRVEFKVLNKETLKREIENRRMKEK